MTLNTITPFGQNVVVFDLETKVPIGGKIRWTDFDLMGISVGVSFDYLTAEYKVYLDDNLDELVIRLNNADIVAGFNIKAFDIPLLNQTVRNRRYSNTNNAYDLLEESRIAAGWTKGQKIPIGLRLNDHLTATFGPAWVKTELGHEAPVMFQQGEMGRLISYCIADVKREAMLLEHVYRGSPVKTKTNGAHILTHPERVIARARRSSLGF